MKKIILLGWMLLMGKFTFCQYVFTQLNQNDPVSLNPSFAGSANKSRLVLSSSSVSQSWTGPQSSLTFDKWIKNLKGGIGLIFEKYDRYSISACYAPKFTSGNSFTISPSVGLKYAFKELEYNQYRTNDLLLQLGLLINTTNFYFGATQEGYRASTHKSVSIHSGYKVKLNHKIMLSCNAVFKSRKKILNYFTKASSNNYTATNLYFFTKSFNIKLNYSGFKAGIGVVHSSAKVEEQYTFLNKNFIETYSKKYVYEINPFFELGYQKKKNNLSLIIESNSFLNNYPLFFESTISLSVSHTF